MAPATAPTFSLDTLAVLLLALKDGGNNPSRPHYEIMSALDGNRTVDSFQHQFRGVIARANELKARKDAGEKFEPVKPTLSRAGQGAGGAKKEAKEKTGKRARATKAKTDAGDVEDEEVETQPPKKTRKRATPKSKQETSMAAGSEEGAVADEGDMGAEVYGFKVEYEDDGEV